MTIYSSYRASYSPDTETAAAEPNSATKSVAATDKSCAAGTSTQQTTAPAAIVGFGVAAALMVLLLMCQSELSAMSFAVDALETEIGVLESRQEKLLVEQARVYSLDRVEAYAVNELGMVKPNPDQYIYIEPGIVRETTKTAP